MWCINILRLGTYLDNKGRIYAYLYMRVHTRSELTANSTCTQFLSMALACSFVHAFFIHMYIYIERERERLAHTETETQSQYRSVYINS